MTVEASIELRREKGRARSPRFYDNSPVVIVAVPVADRMCTSFYVMISKLNVYRKVLCDCPSIDLEIVEVIRLCNKWINGKCSDAIIVRKNTIFDGRTWPGEIFIIISGSRYSLSMNGSSDHDSRLLSSCQAVPPRMMDAHMTRCHIIDLARNILFYLSPLASTSNIYRQVWVWYNYMDGTIFC